MNCIGIAESVWVKCLEDWLKSLRSVQTRRAYQQAITDFLTTPGISSLETASRRDVGAWVNTMRERALSENTIQLRLSGLSSFFQFAADEYTDQNGQPLLTRANPAGGKAHRRRIAKYGKGRALSAAEAVRLLGAIDQNTINGLRDYALITGYLVLGRRNSEWHLARADQFEHRDGGVFFRWSGKNHQDELMEVPVGLWSLITTYVQASGGRGAFDYIFLNRAGKGPITGRRVGDIVSRYASLAGLGHVRVHDLRHTAAMLRRKAGADVENVKDFLKHSSLATTQVYLHRIETVNDPVAKQVMEMLKIGQNIFR